MTVQTSFTQDVAPIFIQGLQAKTIAMLLVFMGLSWWVYGVLYNIYFHPLRGVPGPRIAAISNIPYCVWLLSGRMPYKLLELHDRYGHAVRTAPNEVSFSSAQSWADIYGVRPGHKTFIKGNFYDGGSFAGIGTASIISERKPEAHRNMRDYLSNAFSDRAITKQEATVASLVDKFIQRVGELGSQRESLNMMTTLQSLTFDITGSLSLGASFGALERDKPHPWISISINAMMQGEIIDVLNRFPILLKVVPVVMARKLKTLTEDTKKNEQFAFKAVQSRMARQAESEDFLTRILEDRDPTVVTDRQIAAHASDLVIAGSDTTATVLSALIYYLLLNPTSMSRLTAEIRDGFRKYEDINNLSTAPLQYLRVCLLESMRIYPPVPMSLPRVVPDGGDTVDGIFLPGGTTVYTSPIAASLGKANFRDPMSFNPERWIKRNEGDDLDASQPFSVGVRACIGRNLAWMDMRTTLVKLLWVYDLELAQPIDWQAQSKMHTLWRKPDLMVRVKNRGVEVPSLVNPDIVLAREST
ncbi:benzoate 4-monooxygenase cytochrome P450 [Xylaria grammica]|nr:benzoate 4-monooxygenase cytochrome P450 [Xylaria grammica]